MSNYTPGPWMVDEDIRPGMSWNRHIYGANGLAVCFLAHSNDKAPERDASNANLIAAAPDLLEALDELLNDVGRASSLRGAVKARAAIRKATEGDQA